MLTYTVHAYAVDRNGREVEADHGLTFDDSPYQTLAEALEYEVEMAADVHATLTGVTVVDDTTGETLDWRA